MVAPRKRSAVASPTTQMLLQAEWAGSRTELRHTGVLILVHQQAILYLIW